MIKIKLTHSQYNAIRQYLTDSQPKEAQIFGIVKEFTPGTYCVRKLILPGEDMVDAGPAHVRPKPLILKPFYQLMSDKKMVKDGNRVLIIHSHPFSKGRVSFSGIDDQSMKADTGKYKMLFGERIPVLNIVFNHDCSRYDGRIVYSGNSKYKNIDQITIIGQEFKKIYRINNNDLTSVQQDKYARMINTYDLNKMLNLDIVIAGLGGTGSCTLERILREGWGENSTTTLVDHDKIEMSNLARITYASPNNIGQHKVIAARRYAERITPHRNVKALPTECLEKDAQNAIANADVIIGCVDSELARYALNKLSKAFLVPYLDFGTGIHIDNLFGKETTMASGQARLYIPGQTPCIMCNTAGISLDQMNMEIARKNMNNDEKELLERTGYIRNLIDSKDIHAPSVYGLNQAVVSIGFQLFAQYILKRLPEHNSLMLNYEGQKLQKINNKSTAECPVCADHEDLGNGDYFDLNDMLPQAENNYPPPEPSTINITA